jgi:hypothetical protein
LLLQEQKLQESRALENTIEFQEALIEERDHGIAGEGRGGSVWPRTLCSPVCRANSLPLFAHLTKDCLLLLLPPPP